VKIAASYQTGTSRVKPAAKRVWATSKGQGSGAFSSKKKRQKKNRHREVERWQEGKYNLAVRPKKGVAEIWTTHQGPFLQQTR